MELTKCVHEEPIEKLQKMNLDMLIFFDKFCKESGLNYSISGGSVLGLVRHNGHFIPWDDDVDVDMPFEDYLKLPNMWKKYGNKDQFFLQTIKTDIHSPYLFYRIRKNGTTSMDIRGKNVPSHWGLPIDIFPSYNAPKGEITQKIMFRLFAYANGFSVYSFEHPNASYIKKKFYNLLSRFFLAFVHVISKFCANSGLIFAPFASGVKRIYEKKIMYPPVKRDFEGVNLFFPASLSGYLQWRYNDNYMEFPPEQERVPHPCYAVDLEKDYKEYQDSLLYN